MKKVTYNKRKEDKRNPYEETNSERLTEILQEIKRNGIYRNACQ